MKTFEDFLMLRSESRTLPLLNDPGIEQQIDRVALAAAKAASVIQAGRWTEEWPLGKIRVYDRVRGEEREIEVVIDAADAGVQPGKVGYYDPEDGKIHIHAIVDNGMDRTGADGVSTFRPPGFFSPKGLGYQKDPDRIMYAAKYPSGTGPSAWLQRFREFLCHELTHALDPKSHIQADRRDGLLRRYRDDDSDSAHMLYKVNPGEFEAYSNELIRKIIRRLESVLAQPRQRDYWETEPGDQNQGRTYSGSFRFRRLLAEVMNWMKSDQMYRQPPHELYLEPNEVENLMFWRLWDERSSRVAVGVGGRKGFMRLFRERLYNAIQSHPTFREFLP